MSYETRHFSVDDRLTPLRVLFKNRSTFLVQDISAYTVTFSMYDTTTSDAKVTDGACSFTTDGTDGKAYYPWASGDLDTSGSYWGYFKLSGGGLDARYPQTGNKLRVYVNAVP